MGKVLVQGKMGFSRSVGRSSLGGMREGFPEEMMNVEEFKLGNEHDQVCRTF